ncbi:MAG TPA: exodeoxyribonuclease VII small subunit [Deltaproteobacteria bacterium]|nr:exodeoxyribonuclease VII small subunit [Deltaproteobacteria bacterium]
MKKKGYSETLQDLEAIIDRMHTGEIPIDQLGTAVKQAADMIAFLRNHLKATEAEITAILKGLEEDADKNKL